MCKVWSNPSETHRVSAWESDGALQSRGFLSSTQFFLYLPILSLYLAWFTFISEPLQMPLTSGTFLPLFHGRTHPAHTNFVWLPPLSTPTQVANMMGENDTTRHLVLLWIHNDKPSNGQSQLACSVFRKCFSTFPDACLMSTMLILLRPFFCLLLWWSIWSHTSPGCQKPSGENTLILPALQWQIYLHQPILSWFLFFCLAGAHLFKDDLDFTHTLPLKGMLLWFGPFCLRSFLFLHGIISISISMCSRVCCL